MSTLLQKDYVLLSLDSRNRRGAEVIAKLRGDHADGGIPWLVVVDGEGKQIVTSDGPKGNIGCPVQPNEIAWFRTMLERSRKRLTTDELDSIQQANEAFAKRVLAKRGS
ncbi:MAG TPA: hypothetical protein VFD82_22790 [Planctomycetota bacterium]|nr:hypothetical protein [Planctomycetota bacterium]